MIFPGYEANTDVTCLQMIAKKEVIAKNRGGGCMQPLHPPHKFASTSYCTWYLVPCNS